MRLRFTGQPQVSAIPSMYRINADIAWLAIGLRFAAFADLRRLGLGLFKVTSLPGVGDGLPQVVQMAHGDRCQRSVLRLSKDLIGPLTQLLDRRAAGCVMALIHRRQQADILSVYLSLKPDTVRWRRRSRPVLRYRAISRVSSWRE